MDTDDLEPPKPKHVAPNLEEMSIEDLEDYIAELEATIGRAREVIGNKEKARGAADSVFN